MGHGGAGREAPWPAHGAWRCQAPSSSGPRGPLDTTSWHASHLGSCSIWRLTDAEEHGPGAGPSTTQAHDRTCPPPPHSPSAPATRSLGVLTRGPCRHPTAPRPSVTRRSLLPPLFWNRECPHLCPSSEFFSWGAVRGEATTNSEQEQVPSPAFPAAFSAPGRQCHLSHGADRSVLITPENT